LLLGRAHTTRYERSLRPCAARFAAAQDATGIGVNHLRAMSVFRSLRFRLVVVLTGVVACAMGVVFLYVVPSLRQNLIKERQDHLALIARGQQHAPGLTQAFSSGEHLHKALLHAAHIANGSASGFLRVGDALVPAGGTHPVLP